MNVWVFHNYRDPEVRKKLNVLEDLKHYATRHTHLSIALATTQNIKTVSAIGGITEQTAPGYTKHEFHLMTKKRSFDINDNDELDIVKSIIKKND